MPLEIQGVSQLVLLLLFSNVSSGTSSGVVHSLTGHTLLAEFDVFINGHLSDLFAYLENRKTGIICGLHRVFSQCGVMQSDTRTVTDRPVCHMSMAPGIRHLRVMVKILTECRIEDSLVEGVKIVRIFHFQTVLAIRYVTLLGLGWRWRVCCMYFCMS